MEKRPRTEGRREDRHLPGIQTDGRLKSQRSQGDKGDFLKLSGECLPARLLCKLWAGLQAGKGARPGQWPE